MEKADVFIAFVEQEVEIKQRKEMLTQISKLTEQLIYMDRKIQNLSQTVQQLVSAKNDPCVNKNETEYGFFKPR